MQISLRLIANLSALANRIRCSALERRLAILREIQVRDPKDPFSIGVQPDLSPEALQHHARN